MRRHYTITTVFLLFTCSLHAQFNHWESTKYQKPYYAASICETKEPTEYKELLIPSSYFDVEELSVLDTYLCRQKASYLKDMIKQFKRDGKLQQHYLTQALFLTVKGRYVQAQEHLNKVDIADKPSKEMLLLTLDLSIENELHVNKSSYRSQYQELADQYSEDSQFLLVIKQRIRFLNYYQ